MNEYLELVNAEQRLVMLRALSEMNGSSNESMLQTVLQTYGLPAARDQVKNHLQWLSEQALVRVETVGGTMVAYLTHRGHDVSCGRATCHGVKRPAPGA